MNMQKMKPIISRAVTEQLVREKQKMRTEMATGMMAAVLVMQRDEYGWGKKRIVRIMNEIFAQFEAVADKYVTIDDFTGWLEGIGVKVEKEE